MQHPTFPYMAHDFFLWPPIFLHSISHQILLKHVNYQDKFAWEIFIEKVYTCRLYLICCYDIYILYRATIKSEECLQKLCQCFPLVLDRASLIIEISFTHQKLSFSIYSFFSCLLNSNIVILIPLIEMYSPSIFFVY